MVKREQLEFHSFHFHAERSRKFKSKTRLFKSLALGLRVDGSHVDWLLFVSTIVIDLTFIRQFLRGRNFLKIAPYCYTVNSLRHKKKNQTVNRGVAEICSIYFAPSDTQSDGRF